MNKKNDAHMTAAARAKKTAGKNRSLKDNSVLYRSLFESSSDAIFIVNKSTKEFIDANPAACSLYGYSHDEFKKMKITDISAEPDRSSEAINYGIKKVFTRLHRKKDGTIFPVEITGGYFRNNGISIHTAYIRDISERLKIESRLRSSEEKFSAMFRSSPICTSLVRLSDGKFFEVNEALTRLFGYTRDELIGTGPLELNMWADPEDRNRMIEIFKKKDRVASFETAFRTKTGEIRNMIMISELIRLDNETFALGQSLDITERKIAEGQIRMNLAEKEMLIKEIYHRTKNNMQVIIAMLTLQLNYTSEERVREVFISIKNKIQSMSLVHEMLYQSKNLSSINFHEYITKLAGLLLAAFNAENRIKFNTDQIKDIVLSIDNAIPCGLVLNELITNSIKYAFPENKTGEIKISLDMDSDNMIQIGISDNGKGVGEGFDFRSNSNMGLWIVFNIVEEQLNGSIAFENNCGISCRIRFKNQSGRKKAEL